MTVNHTKKNPYSHTTNTASSANSNVNTISNHMANTDVSVFMRALKGTNASACKHGCKHLKHAMNHASMMVNSDDSPLVGYSKHVMAKHAQKKRYNHHTIITAALLSLITVTILGITSNDMYASENNNANRLTDVSIVSYRDRTEPSRSEQREQRVVVDKNNVSWDGVEEIHIVYSQSTDEKQAISSLKQAVSDGQSSYDKSNGKVVDDNTRTVLKQALDDANSTLSGVNDTTKIDINSFDSKKKAISDAVDNVNASMDAFVIKNNTGNSSSSAASSGLPKTAPVGEMQQWFHDYLISNGYTEDDFSAGVWIINHESGWRVNATNASSGAYGLAQALPGSKMATMGSDWHDNYQTQLKWFINYCSSRYKGIKNAYNFWVKNRWY